MAIDYSRNKDLAGQSVKQGGYTVTYNENGQVTKAVKDGGASATSSKKTTKANDSEAHKAAYEAAKAGDWDQAAAYTNLIYENKTYADGSTAKDLSSGKDYFSELADEFGYNSDKYYQEKYDAVYGEGAWDSGSKSAGGQTAAGIGNGGTSVGGAGGSAGTSGSVQYSAAPTVTDLTEYLKEQYAKNVAAELAGLKSTYEQNAATLQANEDTIADTYAAARNQAAAQSDLEKLYMNEYGLARGLNTGTSGQMALAQSAVRQGNIADIGAQEANALADNNLQLTNLETAYKNAVTQAEAANDANLSNALYNELLRQEQVRQNLASDAQTQANWQAQFDAEQKANAQDYALGLLGSGVMPDASILSAAGISDAEAESLQQIYLQQVALARQKENSGISTSKPVLTYTQVMGAIEDGLVTDTVKDAYKYYLGEDYAEKLTLDDVDEEQITNGSSANGIMLAKSDGSGTVFVSWAKLDSLMESGLAYLKQNSNGKYTVVYKA